MVPFSPSRQPIYLICYAAVSPTLLFLLINCDRESGLLVRPNRPQLMGWNREEYGTTSHKAKHRLF